MRILIIRHAESLNNTLSKISYESYISERTSDGAITETGKKQVWVISLLYLNIESSWHNLI